MSEQITNNILMVRPANFSYNEETASSNAFQTKATKLSKNEVKNLAIKEFDLFVDKLTIHQSPLNLMLFFQIIGRLIMRTTLLLPTQCRPK